MPRRNDYDAVIIGGGPGGSTVATLLAQHGHRVLVLEREKFPRYHIGESLVPYTYKTLKRLGVFDEIARAGFVEKWGLQFCSNAGQLSLAFYFAEAIQDPEFKTWEVTRSRYDQILLDHSRRKGAEVLEEADVVDVLMDGDQAVGVAFRMKDDPTVHEARARFVVDASGRSAVVSRKLGLLERDHALDQIAVWRYVQGAYRQPGIDAGNIVIMFLEQKGWFWWIPLEDNLSSVGCVGSARYMKSKGVKLQTIYENCVETNPLVKKWLSSGEFVSDYYTTGDYSYTSKQFSGDGWVLVGDAAAFIDPVFSTGMFLSMNAGELAADAIHEGLVRGDTSRKVFDAYEETFHKGEDTFRIFVDAFYDVNFSASEFRREHPEWFPEWGRVLLGDVFNDNRAFCDFLIDYRRARARKLGTEDSTRIYIPETWIAKA